MGKLLSLFPRPARRRAGPPLLQRRRVHVEVDDRALISFGTVGAIAFSLPLLTLILIAAFGMLKR